MIRKIHLPVLAGASAVLFAAARVVPGTEQPGPVTTAAVAFVTGTPAAKADSAVKTATSSSTVGTRVSAALSALSRSVTQTSHPRALEDAFRSYFAYKAENPGSVRKPYLYFVDYGLPNTAKRGWVFDMETLEVVDGPFTVAAGRGSPADSRGVPTRFSNASGSAATSLGLYLAQETYAFGGKAMGRFYRSIGLRLAGLSGNFNDNARARGVVAHGAPYVSATKAGRSEGCPAMEEARAQRLLPKLANGGMVFLFAPDQQWLGNDPWVIASANAS
jgi:hypothetical protein